MRIGILTVVLLTLTIQLFSASPVKSQSIDKVEINLQLKNESLIGAFKKIERESPFYFMYRNQDIQSINNLNISISNKPVSYILKAILSNTALSFRQVDNRILISVNAGSKTNANNADKSLATDGNDVFGNVKALKDSTITGQITDSKGETLPGVIVRQKAGNAVTTTDLSGKFRLTVTGNNPVLIISYVGYSSQEVAVNGKSLVNIKLEEALTDLDEVVVVGYGTAKKSDLVGATSSVSVKDMKNQPSSRVDELLQGRSPGVQVQLNSAAPNGGVTIRVRGSNSLSGNNDPLVVIDGFIGGDLGSINPNDIGSIEVLKDASATAIYGSRGANGVILVTTKVGVSNKTSVQYNGYMNFQSLRKKMDLMDAAQYAQTVNENRADIGSANRPFTQAQIDAFKINGGTDWQDQVFHDAVQQSHQVSVSGGGDNSHYFVSGNYLNNNGIILGSSFKRYSIRSNQESKVSKRVTVGVNLFVTKSEDHPSQTGGGQDSSPTQGALLWSPTLPVYQANGAYTLPSTSPAFGPPAVFNPVALAVEPIRNNISYRTELNSFVSYNILKGLTAKVQFGYRIVDNENSSYSNTKPAGGVGNASASINNSRASVLQNTNQLTYARKFGQVHDINITAVYEQSREINNSSSAGAQGFSTDALTYNNLSLGTIPATPTSTLTQKDIQSALGRVSYTLMDKYLINVAGRYDGASVFGETHKWGFFPSGALAWRINKEGFMQKFTDISDLKLRTSYGITGSQAVGPYSSLSSLSTRSPYDINGTSNSVGVGLGSLGNPDLKWERTAQFNAGFDLGLFNERLTFTADYYNKETSDLLMTVPLPLTSGYSGVLRNVGKVQNRGFELNLAGSPFVGKFRWTTSLNYSVNKNKVISLNNGSNEVTVGTTGFPNFGNTIFLDVGQPIGVLKGYIQDGIWGTAEAAKAASYGTIPGAPKYRDIDKNGIINGNDIAIMGNTQPKFTFGWTNTFSYQNFDLNVFLQGSYGNKVYNETRIRSERSSSDADATSIRILNRWSPTNQNTDVPSFQGSNNNHEQLQSSRWMEDGSYLRFKTITLGYNLPKSILSKVNIAALRIYVSGVNLITFTKYSGYDPEASTSVGTSGGIDQAPYPSQKMYTVGANVSF